MKRRLLAALVLSAGLTLAAPASAAPAHPVTAAAAKTVRHDDGGLTRRTRWLLAMIIVDVTLVAWWRGWLNPGAGARGLTLYDDPEHQRADEPRRQGRPPSLR
ncbi:MAG: hypothetical protein ACYDH6_12560 [Acidimicrobiales bacterium]